MLKVAKATRQPFSISPDCVEAACVRDVEGLRSRVRPGEELLIGAERFLPPAVRNPGASPTLGGGALLQEPLKLDAAEGHAQKMQLKRKPIPYVLYF